MECENPGDDDLQTLHTLRIGLCIKIEQGSIGFDRANKLFNQTHELVIESWKWENELEQNQKQG